MADVNAARRALTRLTADAEEVDRRISDDRDVRILRDVIDELQLTWDDAPTDTVPDAPPQP